MARPRFDATMDPRFREGDEEAISNARNLSESDDEDAALILYPAIDLKGGQCVRLRRGDMAQATVFNADPADQARRFEAAGAEWLHIVDLDGAFAGRAVNGQAVEAILAAAALPCQLGGGIRDLGAIEGWLARGLARVILGTVAVRDPDLVRQACRLFPGRVAVGIDAKGGRVAVEGWAETSDLTAEELARRFEDAGVAAIIHTDIDRDGLLQGVNVEATAALAKAVRIPVIASGGVAGLEDLRRLLAAGPDGGPGSIAGVVVGRALYDGRLDLAEALALLRAARQRRPGRNPRETQIC
jgi:phosphoribosylformimino-5-aminoimidazole carboxamide ribotide isomerase